ncbi:MAG: Rha family transcriptional regulator [Lachnospiraceae bacterium]|jgi:Rha family phage regulatory protein|nr:Rha family transcriptional regulator [Lachnospiraceae bacterium]
MLVEIIGKRNEERLITTSLKIAEKFGKEHAHVLRDIRDMECSDTFRESNFGLSSYKSTQGKTLPMYEVTRDGFTLLAMGYTGKEAMKFKEDYINAFNAMENELKRIYTERQQWQIERDKGVVIRHILADTIKMKIADSPHKRFAYPNYTNLIYRTLFGKTAKELEQECGVKARENLRDYFTGNALAQVQSMEMLVSSLIGCGWGYEKIKEFLSENCKYKIEAGD